MVCHPAKVPVLSDHHLGGFLVAVLDEVRFPVDEGVELLHLAGVHKEHDFLIARQISAASYEVLLHKVKRELDVATANVIADYESILFCGAECGVFSHFITSR